MLKFTCLIWINQSDAGGFETIYYNFVLNIMSLMEKFFYTANSTNIYLTKYTKGKVGTKLSSDRFLCGYDQTIY